MEPTEFRCIDCGAEVVLFGAEQGVERCGLCRMIREDVLPDEQAEVRERLGVPLTAPAPQ